MKKSGDLNGFLDRGATFRGELARVTGLSRPEAGLGNRALVKEGFAISPAPGVYQLAPPRKVASAAVE